MLPKHFPVTCHTDLVGPGSVFVAIRGQEQDGTMYIPQAIQKGASTIMVQEEISLPPEMEKAIQENKVKLVRVKNTRKALSNASAQHAGHPAQQLKIIGITGTKGKTSTAWIIEHILASAGYKTALLGTIHNKIGTKILPHQLTTPQPDYLHQFFKKCLQEQVEYVVMEVAAQALSLHRVDDIQFDAIIFTNFAKEHGEFYHTSDDYFAAKCQIFNHAKPGAHILLNADEPKLAQLNQENVTRKTFGINNVADYQAQVEEYVDELIFWARCPSQTSGPTCRTEHVERDALEGSHKKEWFEHIQVPTLCGLYNVYNCLAALALAHQLKINGETITAAFATMPPIAGRMEKYILPENIQYIIDYAHTPESYEAVLSLLRKKTDNLIVVFGCGGSRDKEKRPILGFIAAHYADLIILTSDNPRFENPKTIIQDILKGIKTKDQTKIRIEIDRRRAIEHAYTYARKNSIIVLLGKGRDEYQLIKGEKYHFSERTIIQKLYV